MSGKIVFFEDRNFQGRSYECSSDCSEIASHLSRCSSCRVESGTFMVYDRPNFTGQQFLLTRGEYPEYQNTIGFNDCIQSCRMVPMQFLLTRGEYPEYQNTIGFNDCIQSCRMVPMHKGPFKMRIYERPNFEGQMHELTDDCNSIQDNYHMSDMQSCNVMEGYWLMYEQPNYKGRMFYLRPGEYRNLRDISSDDTRFNSVRRITQS